MQRRKLLKLLISSCGVAISSNTLLKTFANSQSKLITNGVIKQHQTVFIESIVSILIPNSQLEESNKLNLAQFVSHMIEFILSDNEQSVFIEGLSLLQKHESLLSRMNSNESSLYQLVASYLNITYAEQARVFAEQSLIIEQVMPANKDRHLCYKCLLKIREFSLLGFFTAEVITGKKPLSHDFPIPYQPCT